MMKRLLIATVLLGLLGSCPLMAVAPNIQVVFQNATAGERESSDIWINFVGGGAPTIDSSTGVTGFNSSASIGYYIDKTGVQQSLLANTSVELDNLVYAAGTNDARVYLDGWISGRMYVSYGSGLTGLGASYTPPVGPYAGWQPAPATIDPNFQVRYQPLELSVVPTTQNVGGTYSFTDTNQLYANLTYIDFTAISLGTQVVNPTPGVKNPTQHSENTNTMINAVGETNSSGGIYEPNSNFVTIGENNGSPIVQIPGNNGIVGPGSYSNTVQFPEPTANLSNFLKVVGPGAMPTTGSPDGPTAFYQSWQPYLDAMETGGSLNLDGTTVTTIAGDYGTGGQLIPYDMNTTFNPGTVTLGGVEYTGYVLMDGTYNGDARTITMPYDVLLESTGLYGANAGYSIDGGAVITAPPNDENTWMVGDFLSGMNFGFIGSSVANPIGAGTIGEVESSGWWAIGNYNNGEFLYAGAQPDDLFYNVYAAGLQPVTDGYGFAYGDRLGDNTTNFTLTPSQTDLGTYFLVYIQPDFAPIPEPTTWALVAIGVALILFRLRRHE